MRVSEAFPSNYLRAVDLQDRTVRVTIDKITMEDIGGESKLILYFEGKEKGIVLNKTNANAISFAYGDDTDNWQGGELDIYPTMVDFQGKQVAAIRVKVPPRRPQQAPRSAQRPMPPPAEPPGGGPTNDLNDDIPF